MEELELLIDLHKREARQGPGGDAQTEAALKLAMVDRDAPLKVADIGCGTGASSLLLARRLPNARITAVDFLQDFLDVLVGRAEESGLAERITPLCCSMEDLPFGDGEFDVIWAEGAIYNVGFEKGVIDWYRYLKLGGLLVVSEITWLTDSRPAELSQFWENAYPEIDVGSAKMRVLEKAGYSPVAYFVLPERCWLNNYYQPLLDGFGEFLERNGNSDEALGLVEAENTEIELYKKYRNYYSYGVYIARKFG